jgi:hypothetical protein
MQVFGGFEVIGNPEDEGADARNVTPVNENPESRATWKRIWPMLKFGKQSDVITDAEIAEVTLEVRQNMDRPNVIKDIEADWFRKIQTRLGRK